MQSISMSGVLFVLCLFVAGSYAEDTACKFWTDLAHNLSQAHTQTAGMLHMTCDNNGPTCSRTQCSAVLNFPSFVPVKEKTVNFCFGLRLNHCDSPVSMSYYVDIPTHNVTQSGKLTHNDTLVVPVENFQGIEGDLLAAVEMTRKDSTHIVFGITGKVRVMIGSIATFPTSLHIFPPTTILTPTCNKTSPASDYKLSENCTAPTVPTTTPTTTTPTPTSKPGQTTKSSSMYKKPCTFGLFECGDNLMCKEDETKKRTGFCVCNDESPFNEKTGQCENKNIKTTTKTPVKPKPEVTTKPSTKAGNSTGSPAVTQASTGKKKGISTTAIIIGGVAGGLLLIVVIAVTVVCIGRHRRNAIYRDRHQLLTDVDDDDDVNMII